MAEDKFTEKYDRNYDDFSNLKSLTEKYGLSEDLPNWVKPNGESDLQPEKTQAYTAAPPVSAMPPLTPKNNTPAKTPRVVYNTNSQIPSLSILFDDDMPKGPEGRRTVYEAEKQISIAEKRRRNTASMQKTEKGSVGFGAQPYVKHVASSQSAMKKDDPTVFSRAYAVTRHDPEKYAVKRSEGEGIRISQNTTGAERLVASHSQNEAQSTPHRHYETTAKDKLISFFKSFIPWSGDPAKEVIRKIVMDISSVVIILCFVFFVNNYLDHRKQIDNQNNLQNSINEPATVNDFDDQWDAIRKRYPDIKFPDGMNIRFAELYAKNQDLVGWLKVGGTNIDTPVLYCSDDAANNTQEDFYLRHNFYKEYDKYGNAYIDRYNSGLTLDKNNTIYGHNMTDGLSFAQLEKYYTSDGFVESPIIQYSTLFDDYYFKIYAVIITNGYKSGDNGYLFNYSVSGFSSTENFKKYIEALDERKLYDTGVDINENDVLLTLSTCSYEIKTKDMGRLAVIGRMVRQGESTAVDTSKVTPNENIRYPQVWYDEHKISNPYANAYKWDLD